MSTEKPKKTRKKRTTKKKPIKPVGDIVETVLEKTGVAKVAKFILGEDCGCDKRKEKLNDLFKKWRKPECLHQDEYEYLKEWYKEERSRMKPSEQKQILKIYNRIFSVKRNPTSCASCLREINARLKQVFDTYED